MKKTSSIIWFATFSVVAILLSQFPAVDAQTGSTWAVDANNNIVTAIGTANVGVNTTGPDLPLTIGGSPTGAFVRLRDGSNQWHITGSSGAGLGITESNVSSRLFLKKGGSVGINISSPFGGIFSGNGLDVNGILKVGGQGFNEATTGAGGMMYYNGTKFRCNEAGSWKDCVVGGGSGGGIGNDAPSPNALPRWTSTGNAFLTNSNISDNGTQVTISKPTSITGSLSASSITVTGGSPTVCQAGQVLAGATVRGGLVTGGTCSTFVSSTPGFSFFGVDPNAPSSGVLVTTGGINHLGVGATGGFGNTISLTVRARNGGTGWIQMQDNAGNNTWHLGEGSGGFNFTESGVSSRIHVEKGTGNVGLSTQSPGAKLEVNGNSNNLLRLRRSSPGSIDVFVAVGSGTGDTMCGAPSAGACLAAFDGSRSSIDCGSQGAVRALCAKVGD